MCTIIKLWAGAVRKIPLAPIPKKITNGTITQNSQPLAHPHHPLPPATNPQNRKPHQLRETL